MSLKKWLRHAVYTIGLITALITPIFSQNKSATVSETNDKITLDGILNEESWKSAESITNLVQHSPKYGAKPTKKTEIKILKDKNNIYVGFICHQKKEAVKSPSLIRDRIWGGDYFGITIDMNNDKRTAYLFGVNPLNIQDDGIRSNNGTEYNEKWDYNWLSKTKITDEGWQGEMQIPIERLKFNENDDSWGINFLRLYDLNKESYTWSLSKNPFKIDKFNKIKNVKGFSKKNKIDIAPYLQLSTDLKDTLTRDWGFDSKYDPTNNTSIYVTYNPDFSQIEADPEQFNLSTDQLFLEERRIFFTEGLGMMATPLNLVYTRTMDDIIAGAKIIGKEGKHSFLLLNAQTKEESNNPNTTFTIAKYKLDLLKSSNIGLIAINKQNNERFNRTVGLDMQLNLPKDIVIKTIGAGTQTENKRSGNAFKASLDWRINPYLTTNINATSVDSTFNNELGFETHKGEKGVDFSITKIINLDPVLKQIVLRGIINKYVKQNNEFASQFSFVNMLLNFSNKVFVIAGHSQNKESVLGELYNNKSTNIDLSINPSTMIKVDLSYQRSNFLDEEYNKLRNKLEFQSSKGIVVKETTTYLRNLDQKKTSWIHSVNALYKINEQLQISAFAQTSYNDGIINIKNSKNHDLNSFIKFNPNKMTDLYLIYNQAMKEDDKNKGLFFKASRQF